MQIENIEMSLTVPSGHVRLAATSVLSSGRSVNNVRSGIRGPTVASQTSCKSRHRLLFATLTLLWRVHSPAILVESLFA